MYLVMNCLFTSTFVWRLLVDTFLYTVCNNITTQPHHIVVHVMMSWEHGNPFCYETCRREQLFSLSVL